MRARLMFFGGFFTGAGLALVYTYYVLTKFITSFDRGIIAPLEKLMLFFGSQEQYQQIREMITNLYGFADSHLLIAFIALFIGIILTIVSVKRG